MGNGQTGLGTRDSGLGKARWLRALALSVLLLVAGAASAQQKATGAIDAKTFDKLMKAQELAEKGQYDDALAELDQLKGAKLNSYATAQMLNFYAYIYASKSDYKKAIAAYQEVLKQEGAPEGLKLTAKYTIAQLYFQTEDYKSCIRLMEEWLATAEKPTATAHIMLAQAYYQIEGYDKALANVGAAIKLETEAGKPVQEAWLRLAAALYYAKNDYARTAQVYEQLLARYPKVSYLKQLAGMYSELGQDMKRLAVYDAAYEHGGLKNESEVLNLAYMFLGQNMPYKAGRVIEMGMEQGLIEKNGKNIETLANAWAAASEHKKAIPALTEAAKRSDKGLLYARLAGVHFDAGDYDKAAEAAIKADQKGGLKSEAGNLMLLGMAYFNSKKYEDALQAFRRAKQDKKMFSDAAKWEEYTRSEIERIRALEKAKFELKKRTEEAIKAAEEKDAVQMRDQ
jgi:tetratricopeptide (TPR) repeat protein